MKFSDILSKSVISLYNGSNEGIVISGYFDKPIKKLIALEIASNEDFYNENENNQSKEPNANQNENHIAVDEFILPTKNIFAIGQDAITIKNNAILELKLTADNLTKFSPINCQAYSTNGKLLGRITDIALDDNFNVISFNLDDTTIDATKIASHSKGTIIFYDDNFKTKVDKLRPNPKLQSRLKNKSLAQFNDTLPKAHILPTTQPIPQPQNNISPQPNQVDNNLILNDATTQNDTQTTTPTQIESENINTKPKQSRNIFSILFKGKSNEEQNQTTTPPLQKFETNDKVDLNEKNLINENTQQSTTPQAQPKQTPPPAHNNANQFINLNATTANSLQMQRPLTNANIQRLTANSNLLIGKKITRTISTQNGELIGKKGNLITNKTIYLATAHQKLRELVLYCE